MFRSFRLLPLVAIIVVGMAAFTWAGGATRAQEATPAADEASMEGLSYTSLGVLSNLMLPSPADVEVARVGFAPGAGFPFEASSPFGVIVIMESGTLTATVAEQAWTISRGAALAEAMATPAAAPDLTGVMEEVAMGAEATLEAGDVAYVPGGVNGEVRNNGQEAVSAIVISLGPSGAMMGAATPAP